MRRGEIWTASGGADCAGKPRPVVIVQADDISTTASITICPFTSDPRDAPLFRLLIAPAAGNGLQVPSRIMVDKVTTVSKGKLGRKVGQLGAPDIVRLNRAITVFLGLAG